MRKKSEYFEIKESTDELQEILENRPRKDYTKLQFLLLLKDEENSYSHIREILGVSFKTMMIWKYLYKKGGLSFLLKSEISEKDNVLLQEQVLFHSSADLNGNREIATIQKNGEDIYQTEGVHALKKWVENNYMTKQDFIDRMDELRSESISLDETVSVLRRMIEFLKK